MKQGVSVGQLGTAPKTSSIQYFCAFFKYAAFFWCKIRCCLQRKEVFSSFQVAPQALANGLIFIPNQLGARIRIQLMHINGHASLVWYGQFSLR